MSFARHLFDIPFNIRKKELWRREVDGNDQFKTISQEKKKAPLEEISESDTFLFSPYRVKSLQNSLQIHGRRAVKKKSA